jgi:hypothetical protein
MAPLWVPVAYYVITDGRIVSVWDFQGAIAPDRELLRVSQAELAGSFGDLYSRLHPRAAVAAHQAKISRLTEPRVKTVRDARRGWWSNLHPLRMMRHRQSCG